LYSNYTTYLLPVHIDFFRRKKIISDAINC
jgi:hypothetical protein